MHLPVPYLCRGVNGNEGAHRADGDLIANYKTLWLLFLTFPQIPGGAPDETDGGRQEVQPF